MLRSKTFHGSFSFETVALLADSREVNIAVSGKREVNITDSARLTRSASKTRLLCGFSLQIQPLVLPRLRNRLAIGFRPQYQHNNSNSNDTSMSESAKRLDRLGLVPRPQFYSPPVAPTGPFPQLPHWRHPPYCRRQPRLGEQLSTSKSNKHPRESVAQVRETRNTFPRVIAGLVVQTDKCLSRYVAGSLDNFQGYPHVR